MRPAPTSQAAAASRSFVHLREGIETFLRWGRGKVWQEATMRERMAQHRANPVCASCHAQMDLLGVALENFDFVGRWRTRDESLAPIDASGALPDGTPFQGIVGLRQAMLKRPDQFVSTMTEKLLAYALGRGIEYHDAPAVRKIVGAASHDDYRFSSLILGIVESLPFQMKRSQS